MLFVLQTSGQNMKQDEQLDCKWRVQQKMASEKSELEKRLLQLEVTAHHLSSLSITQAIDCFLQSV